MANERLSRKEVDQRRAEKVSTALEVLAHEVAALCSGEDWRHFLDFQARLHAYSPNNVLLIYAQHAAAFREGRVAVPDPGYVAGFNTWKALRRSVDRGQHGYAVLAPVRRTERVATDGEGKGRSLVKDEQPSANEVEEARQSIRGYKVEYVFSEHQTAGEPLPEPPCPRLLRGQAPPGLRQAVTEFVESKGFTVGSAPDAAALNGANGVTEWASHKVLIREDMDDAAKVKTLMHEAAHVILHAEPPGMFLPRHRKEVEAESAAFVVAAAHGMPTDDYSFPYVATWSSQAKDPAREIAATQARVAQAANEILTVSPAERSTGGRVPGVEQALEVAREARKAAEHDPVASRASMTIGVA